MYDGKKKVNDILKFLRDKNTVKEKSIPAWPGPGTKSFHGVRYDEMI